MPKPHLAHSIFCQPEPFIIAEVAQAHDGSLGMAHAFIDAAAETGVDAVKFQTHIASEESSLHEPWRVPFGYEDDSRYAYWERMEFTDNQWEGLKQHADDRGLVFLSSPFSIKAVYLLERLEVPFWKVASGEVGNSLLIEHILRTGKPIILSSGMSSLEELDRTTKDITQRKVALAIMQCTTSYPCPPDKIGLNLIQLFAERYHCPVGLSDHSATIYPCIAAAALGAQFFEAHLTLDKRMFGPDTQASLSVEAMKQMVDGIRAVHQMITHPLDKDQWAATTLPMRKIFNQSLVAACDIPAGTPVQFEQLTCRKPLRGIPAGEFEQFLGKSIAQPIEKG
ncbi:MAG: N-acetylneuraminate synthase family protein, partial [Verrucomicrobiota bacterium]